MVYHNGQKYNVRKFDKQLRNQLKMLSKFESSIINKLRSECINLNGYKHFKYGESNGNCVYCKVEETVEHFLINCGGSKCEYANYYNEFEMDYDIIRYDFKQNLKKIAAFFNQEINFNVINLLFPNIWQKEPKKTNPNYFDIKRKNEKRVIEILKLVVKFVKDTKRFKKEKFGY